MAFTVLKAKHNLVGKSLIPVILRMKVWEGEPPIVLARLKKGYPLEDYSLVELRMEFERLTGESVKDILALTGKDDNIETVRLLMSYSIEHANSVGAPRGQILQSCEGTGDAVDLMSSERTPAPPRSADTGKTACNTSVEDQLRSMREDLKVLKGRKEDMQVDEALSAVRSLASRPTLTSHNVLLAAIETLIETANKANHKDASLFSKSYSICKRYEENDDFCGLVLKLFGTQEDKKIAAVVADWAKSKKYAESEKSKSNYKENSLPAASIYPAPNNSGIGPMYPLQVPYQQMMHSYPYIPPGFYGPRPPVRPSQLRRGKQSGQCFYCKGTGHFVASCPKLADNKKMIVLTSCLRPRESIP